MAQRGQTPLYLTHTRDRTQLVTVGGNSVFIDASPTKAFLGFGADFKRDVPLVALETKEQVWQISLDNLPLREVWTSESERVMGVIQEPSYDPALVTIQDGRRLHLKGPNWGRTIVESVDPIVDAAVSPADASIAYVTDRGTFAVYSLTQQKELCRYSREPE